jgi:hypothetical protein
MLFDFKNRKKNFREFEKKNIRAESFTFFKKIKGHL